LGRIVRSARETDLAVYYAYDQIDRLTAEVWRQQSDSTQLYGFWYSYDEAHNRLQMRREGAAGVETESAYYSYQADNALDKRRVFTPPGTFVYTYYYYDLNGALTAMVEDGAATYYGYGANQLIERIEPASGSPWYFRYDGQLNRYAIDKGGTVAYYLWDGLKLLQEWDANGTWGVRYTQAYSRNPDIGSIAEVERHPAAGVSYFQYLHMDHRGTVAKVTDAGQNTQIEYTMDAFGRELAAPSGADPAVPNDFIYQTNWMTVTIGGKRYGLSKYRLYDFETGAFLSRDPIGSRDGLNRYNYCAGDPVNRSDPMGTDDTYVDSGVVYYQGESGFWETNVGNPIAIGTLDGSYINLFKSLGGKQVHYASFAQAASELNRGPASVANIRGLIGDVVGFIAGPAMGSDTPVLDTAIGGAKVLSEPVRLLRDTAYAAGHVVLTGSRATSEDIAQTYGNSEENVAGASMLFTAVGQQLDSGKSRTQVIVGNHGYDGLVAQMVLRSNPITGTAMGAYNATSAGFEGRYEEVGMEGTGLGLQFFVALAPVKAGGQYQVPYGRLPVNGSQFSIPTFKAIYLRFMNPALVQQMHEAAIKAAQDSKATATTVIKDPQTGAIAAGYSGTPAATTSILTRLRSGIFSNSLERWLAGNCSEPHAFQATGSGTRNVVTYTIRTKTCAPFPRCRNCQITTADAIALSDPTPPPPVQVVPLFQQPGQ